MLQPYAQNSNSLYEKASLSVALQRKISIVIPLYNESKSVAHLQQRLERAQIHLDKYIVEFVLVDDASQDDTLNRLKSAFADTNNVKIVAGEKNLGVMGAIMFGLNHASHNTVCSMDSDCSYAPEDICKLVDALHEGVTMVVGSPYHPDARVHNVPRWRIVVSKAASTIYRWLLRTKLNCYTSCFRAYRKQDIENIHLKRTGFEGTVELVWAVERHNLKTVECPADLHVRQHGQSSSKLIPVAIKHLTLIKSIVIHRLFGTQTHR